MIAKDSRCSASSCQDGTADLALTAAHLAREPILLIPLQVLPAGAILRALRSRNQQSIALRRTTAVANTRQTRHHEGPPPLPPPPDAQRGKLAGPSGRNIPLSTPSQQHDMVDRERTIA